jgi:hypothetical protein
LFSISAFHCPWIAASLSRPGLEPGRSLFVYAASLFLNASHCASCHAFSFSNSSVASLSVLADQGHLSVTAAQTLKVTDGSELHQISNEPVLEV